MERYSRCCSFRIKIRICLSIVFVIGGKPWVRGLGNRGLCGKRHVDASRGRVEADLFFGESCMI
jgi:hypothetical protein